MGLVMFKNKNIFKIFNSLVVMYVCFFLSGCISTMRLKPEDAKLIKGIDVNKKIIKPRTIFYQNQNDVLLVAISPLAYVIDKDVNGFPERNQIQDVAEEAGINISSILRDEVISQIKQNAKFRIVKTKDADAVLNLEIRSYGLSPCGFSSKLGPDLMVIGSLTNSKNKLIWKNIASVGPYGQMPKFSKQELLHDPHNIYLEWDEAAKEAARKLVRKVTFRVK